MTRIRARLAAAGLALTGCLAGAACTDLDRLLDIAFPPRIDGLPAGSSWVTFPIGSWVTEGEVEATAMAACFAPTCEPRAAVAIYRASGREARLVEELAADPARLARWIEERDRRDPNARRRKLRTEISTETAREGAYRGLSIRLARVDGTHAAFGILLARRDGASAAVVLAIGPDLEAMRRLASSVIAARG